MTMIIATIAAATLASSNMTALLDVQYEADMLTTAEGRAEVYTILENAADTFCGEASGADEARMVETCRLNTLDQLVEEAADDILAQMHSAFDRI
ncbi:UrcA family protein [Parvularcula sp. ZS-1/3]|uniref:UrcA family protein n=1 Tax=Parvularcula mediterranea TaxID=2732508 RepID=A0A7Y3RJG4_9PROT|nr:UrcA family protein [Parvularcula mediterranea]NNU15224.1 UrcA family protein [Parvularcula mediterranea]